MKEIALPFKPQFEFQGKPVAILQLSDTHWGIKVQYGTTFSCVQLKVHGGREVAYSRRFFQNCPLKLLKKRINNELSSTKNC